MTRSALSWLVVAAALLGLIAPQPLDARSSGGRSGGKSSGTYKSTPGKTYKAPKSTRSPGTSTYRSSTRGYSYKSPSFKSSRYVSKSTARTYKAAPTKTPRYWTGGNVRVLSGQTRVVDGDTFVANGRRIRLRGIDTPELGQARSFAAKQRLEQLLMSGTVTVQPRAIDKYGRTVATVLVNGQDVAAIMRAEGYAKPR